MKCLTKQGDVGTVSFCIARGRSILPPIPIIRPGQHLPFYPLSATINRMNSVCSGRGWVGPRLTVGRGRCRRRAALDGEERRHAQWRRAGCEATGRWAARDRAGGASIGWWATGAVVRRANGVVGPRPDGGEERQHRAARGIRRWAASNERMNKVSGRPC
jgi:hypothetical protein